MNRRKARKLIKTYVRRAIRQHEALTDLELEVFGAIPDLTALTDPREMQRVREACKPENVARWLEENKDKPIAEKGDPDAFEKIIEAYVGDISSFDEITDEFCDSVILEWQNHFAGTVMFGPETEDGDDHLFVYEPNPQE